jgi:hypothetical protein
MNKYSTDCLCDEMEYRPRVSYKIRDYVLEFVLEHVIFPKKIMVKDRYNYFVAFILIPFKENEKDEKNEVITWDKWKLFGREKTLHISIFNHLINANIRPEEFASIIYDALAIQFVELYKKITIEDFNKAKKNLDYNYINSLPYPAPFEEQKYTFDSENPKYEQEYIALYGNRIK